MQPITFSTELTLEDWRAFQVAVRAKLARERSRGKRLVRGILGWIAIVLLTVLALSRFPTHDQRAAWMWGVLGGALFVAIVIALAARRIRPSPSGMFLGPVQVTIDATGIHTLRRLAAGSVQWQALLGVDATSSHVFLWTDQIQGFVLPGRSLPAPLNSELLAERIREFIAAAPRAEAAEGTPAREIVVDTSAVVAVPSRTEPEPTVREEITAAMRLLVLLPVKATRLVGRDLSILVLALTLLVVWTVLDPLTSTDDMEIYWYSLPGLAWVAMGVLAVAWVLSRLSEPRIPYRQGLLLATGVLPIAIAAGIVYQWVDERWEILVIGLAAVWVALYFWRGLRALTGLVQGRAILVAVLGACGFAMLSNALYVNPSIWSYVDDDPADPDDGDDHVDPHTLARMEELQFVQQSRLDTEFAQMAALPRKSPASWFVGFAGSGKQRVFADEIDLAAREMAARYDSGDRSVQLVNDRRDPAKLPLASAPALRYTLRRIGALMGPDDVLFLSLSSHGSEDGSISIANDGRKPADLSAIDLAAMLREAKIPWKVIVISACYSGSFIDALRDEHTIVLTASAADRTSFGCSDDRDLTYFGEAFYQDAIPGAPTLRAAFEQAREEIAAMEKTERYPASDPQAYFGAAMEKKLAGMEPKE